MNRALMLLLIGLLVLPIGCQYPAAAPQQSQQQPAAEADKLADSLMQVMTRMVTIQEEIIEALNIARESQTINIEMDGGNFSKDK